MKFVTTAVLTVYFGFCAAASHAQEFAADVVYSLPKSEASKPGQDVASPPQPSKLFVGKNQMRLENHGVSGTVPAAQRPSTASTSSRPSSAGSRKGRLPKPSWPPGALSRAAAGRSVRTRPTRITRAPATWRMRETSSAASRRYFFFAFLAGAGCFGVFARSARSLRISFSKLALSTRP